MNRITCKQCNRFLLEAYGTVVARILCPNSKCKETNDVKHIILDEHHNLKAKFPQEKQND